MVDSGCSDWGAAARRDLLGGLAMKLFCIVGKKPRPNSTTSEQVTVSLNIAAETALDALEKAHSEVMGLAVSSVIEKSVIDFIATRER